jgi:hypothetical protein
MAECALLSLPDRASMSTSVAPGNKPCLEASHGEDLKLAASKRLGSQRRSFQAAMAAKYCQGNPRQAQEVFGWSRHPVALGLHERRTGIVCLGAQEAYWGNKRWEERHPDAAAALRALAETPAQTDPTFRTPLYYTRLTAAGAIKQWRALGFKRLCPRPARWRRCSIAMATGCGQCSRPSLKKSPRDGCPLCQPSRTGYACPERGLNPTLEHRLQGYGEPR